MRLAVFSAALLPTVFFITTPIPAPAAVPSREQIEAFDARQTADRKAFETSLAAVQADPRAAERQKFNADKQAERLALQDSLFGQPAAVQAAAYEEYAAQLQADRTALEGRLPTIATTDRNQAIFDFNEKTRRARLQMIQNIQGLPAGEQAAIIDAFNVQLQADRAALEAKLDEKDPERLRTAFRKKQADEAATFYVS